MYLQRECYVTVDEIKTVKKFKSAINRTFAKKGGVIWQGVNDGQLSIYIMDKLKEFAQFTDAKKYFGVLLIGRQPNFRDVNAVGQFIDDPDNNSGFEMEGSRIKTSDFDTAVYIFSDHVQVCCCKLAGFYAPKGACLRTVSSHAG